ncbi:MAG: alkene reductase [Acidimicrobiaceae bacterium]|nr:alkene reductase [Acidimicrobiaceae bacterium]
MGDVRIANRIVMGPMTRNRATASGTPTPAMATYYAQRASAGLIVTEGTQPSAIGQAYPNTPGLHAAEHVAGWRVVTDAVHEAGGVIFAQLMHSGRIGHSSVLPDGMTPVGPSAIAARGTVYTSAGLRPLEAPRALTEAGIERTVGDFADAAANAIRAGFDGVEVHGGNGYLLHQFLSSNANLRSDGWGGSVAGRIRLPVEVTRAVADRIGAGRVGFRISPNNPYNDIVEEGYQRTYLELVEALAKLGIAYLHVAETGDRALTVRLRARWPGALILNPDSGGHSKGSGDLQLVEEGLADMVSFGALFLANPDLPRRLALGGPFNEPDRATFYGGDELGYTDYPTLAEAASGAARAPSKAPG